MDKKNYIKEKTKQYKRECRSKNRNKVVIYQNRYWRKKDKKIEDKGG